MFLALLAKYWKYLVIIALAGYIISLVKENGSLKVELTKSESKATQYQVALDYQNEQLLNNDKKYLADLQDANKTNIIVRTKYKNIYSTIYSYKGDTNATDCNNSNAFWATITY